MSEQHGGTITLSAEEWTTAMTSKDERLGVLLRTATLDPRWFELKLGDETAAHEALAITNALHARRVSTAAKKLLGIEKQFLNKRLSEPDSRLAHMVGEVSEAVDLAMTTESVLSIEGTAAYLAQLYADNHQPFACKA